MTPIDFEARYAGEWNELETLLQQLQSGKSKKQQSDQRAASAKRIAALYRRACEQLALARARAFPAHLVDRLESMTQDAHQVIYSQRDFGMRAFWHLIFNKFPQAVRAHAAYVWIATAVFVLPTLILGVLVYQRPELILAVVDAGTAQQFDQMYSPDAESIGRARDADTDWTMFGFYIRNNMTVALQCFASGLAAGLGSLFFLAFNGAYAGAIAGYLTERGLGETFYSFVVTHAAFELTAIVLSGAAGLRLGHAWLAPGRRTRTQSLVHAAREVVVIVYGVLFLLLIAAAVEAFWSSGRWIPLPLKYGVAAICWAAVIGWLVVQGRRAS
jgi:uncharacterized membrane protein SpoIIM required for sporulation